MLREVQIYEVELFVKNFLGQTFRKFQIVVCDRLDQKLFLEGKANKPKITK